MLYRFDGVDERLELLPMAARRALDRAGRRLPLDGWRSLSLEERRALVEAGAGAEVDVERVLRAISPARPAAESMDPVADPPPQRVPPELVQALGVDRPLGDAVWAALGPLDRYTLVKVAARGRPERLAAAYTELVGHSSVSTHLEPSGGARMVDVGSKPETRRVALAESRVQTSPGVFRRLLDNDTPKGDVLGTARLAGILAAKRTAELIPLCHSVALTRVGVELELDEADRAVVIRATAEATDRTGVEMEALVAASVAGLTVYDMLKGLDRAMAIGPTRLVKKSGGRSGDFEQ